MDRLIFQEIAPEKRESHLDANCDEVIENFEYLKELTELEKAQEEEHLATTSVKLMKIMERFEKVKKEFEKQIKPLKIEVAQITTILKDGGVKCTGNCYVMKDFTTNEIGTYNKEGILVSLPRKMKTEETQSTIFNKLREESKELKDGTNN